MIVDIKFLILLLQGTKNMKIDYTNKPIKSSRVGFVLRYLMNIVRSWIYFHLIWRNVKYKGFIRVMKGTSFASGFKVVLGHNVQFGDYCNVATDLIVGDNVLLAGRVCFVGKNDHQFNVPCKTIWSSERLQSGATIVGDDVWIGHGATVVGPVQIGRGSVVAAGAVVTKDIPECEIWGGVPAKKLGDRFKNLSEKQQHLNYLESLKSGKGA